MKHYYSTGNASLSIDFMEAVRMGLAPDGGLLMPVSIEPLPQSFWSDFTAMNFNEVSFRVASHFLQGAIGAADLRKIIDHTLQFDAPLVALEENISSLELYHGPTMAFKDFGARFLSGVMALDARRRSADIFVLVATSGDTGSAVANGFLNVPGTRVIVLYPSGKVSEIQEKQFTTLGGNITALEIAGTFDDCQRLVKLAFADKQIREKRTLTSANSINIARLLPQMFYYFRAVQQLPPSGMPLYISVPSGNFGNLTAGLMAKRMGLPVLQFVASTNINDVVPEYLRTGSFRPGNSRATISNAMDVGNPSNFARMLALYRHDLDSLRHDVSGYTFTDEQTRTAMKEVYGKHGYVLDPHGAVSYLGLRERLRIGEQARGIFLETAHPGKFNQVVESAIGVSAPLPDRLLAFMQGEKKSIQMKNDFQSLKDLLLDFD